MCWTSDSSLPIPVCFPSVRRWSRGCCWDGGFGVSSMLRLDASAYIFRRGSGICIPLTLRMPSLPSLHTFGVEIPMRSMWTAQSMLQHLGCKARPKTSCYQQIPDVGSNKITRSMLRQAESNSRQRIIMPASSTTLYHHPRQPFKSSNKFRVHARN